MWATLLSLPYTRVAVAMVLCTALAASHWKAYSVGKHTRDAEISAADTTRAQGMLRLVENAQRKQAEIQEAADKQRELDNAQITKLGTDYTTAIAAERVRRNSRPAGYVPPTPAASAAGPGCSAASLFAEDAAVALGFAAEADRLRITILGLEARYNKVKDELRTK